MKRKFPRQISIAPRIHPDGYIVIDMEEASNGRFQIALEVEAVDNLVKILSNLSDCIKQDHITNEELGEIPAQTT